jgi:hypothetical protein
VALERRNEIVAYFITRFFPRHNPPGLFFHTVHYCTAIPAAVLYLVSDMSRLFTGAPTDKAIWMLVGGVAACIGGVVGLWRG